MKIATYGSIDIAHPADAFCSSAVGDDGVLGGQDWQSQAYKLDFEELIGRLEKAKGRIDDMNDASYYEDTATLLNRVEGSEFP
jgi:hypothetical protein